jgi:MFS family permease
MIVVAAVARLPLAAVGVAVLVHVQHLTGSFAVAGAVCGALAAAQGVGGPLLGRCVDGRGQTGALVGSALAAAGALVALALAPAGAPVLLLLALAAVVGAATPPVGACVRTLLGEVVPAGDALRRAYAVDAATTELTWVAGPPLVLLVVAVADPGAALLAVAAVVVVGTLRFAALPASRRWRPVSAPDRGRRPVGGGLATPGMRTLVLVLVGVGVLFGATEVAVTASAEALGSTVAAGPLLGLWGVGSLLGGAVAARAGGGARTADGLAGLLGALGAGHLALAGCSGSAVGSGVVLVAAGAMIAPVLATCYAMVDGVAPAGAVTEAFAWIATASAVGSSAGAALGGAIADTAGPAAAFVVAGAAGLLAALVAVARRTTLPPTPALPTATAPVAA